MLITLSLLESLRRNDPTLIELDLSNTELPLEEVGLLCEALRHNTVVAKLDVSGNAIGDAGAVILAQNTTLTSLHACDNNIGDTGAVSLARNTTLTLLDVSYNRIGGIGAASLARNTTLRSLIVSGNDVGDIGVAVLAQNRTLRSLIVGSNDVGDAGVAVLAQNTTLLLLDVSFNQISALGAAALAQNTTLASLTISGNNLGDAGAIVLAGNTNLSLLDVGFNAIGDAGAVALAQNAILTSLSVGDNNIGNPGAAALAQNTTLASLGIGDNFVGEGGLATLAQNKTLTSLDVVGNPLDDAQQEHLLQVIATNRYQQQCRRNQFIRALLILAADSVNPQSQSFWSRLPTELVLLIFSHLQFRGVASIGKNATQVYRCTVFILTHIQAIRAAWRRGEGFILHEQLSRPLRSSDRFTLSFVVATRRPLVEGAPLAASQVVQPTLVPAGSEIEIPATKVARTESCAVSVPTSPGSGPHV